MLAGTRSWPPGLPGPTGCNQDDAAVPEQKSKQHDDRGVPEARGAAALVVLARLMGRLAARERLAASLSEKDEGHEEPEG